MAFLQCNFDSAILESKAKLNVVLPADIRENERLKVLYLLHGYTGDYTDWMRMTAIERYVSDYRVLVVMPDVGNSYYTDMENGGKYYTFLTKELFSWVESVFPISLKREDTFICGLSMGGFGAFKIALNQPERFIKAASLSGALNIERIRKLSMDSDRDTYFKAAFGGGSTTETINDLKFVSRRIKKDNSEIPELYLACGTEDFLYEQHAEFTLFLTKEKVKFLSEESRGEHNWAFWDEYIQKVLKWMFE